MMRPMTEPAMSSAVPMPRTVFGGRFEQSFAMASANTTFPSSEGWKRMKPKLNHR